jgi:hypothetical protein
VSAEYMGNVVGEIVIVVSVVHARRGHCHDCVLGKADRGCWVTFKRSEATPMPRATGSLRLVVATHVLEMRDAEDVQRTIEMQDDVLLSASNIYLPIWDDYWEQALASMPDLSVETYHIRYLIQHLSCSAIRKN